MRLIDADNLNFEGQKYNKSQMKSILDFIDSQSTAYDVDKVVEQLDKISDYYECDEQGREHVQMVDLAEAIEIVKAGGIDG